MVIRNKTAKSIIAILAALLAFSAVGILVTEFLQNRIYFSLFFGIPAAIIAGLIAFLIVLRKLG